jgi:hypothetical protein
MLPLGVKTMESNIARRLKTVYVKLPQELTGLKK